MTTLGRRRQGLAGVVLVLSSTLLFSEPARAALPSCSYNATTKVVTATAAANFPQVSMGLHEGDEIRVNGVDCGKGTRFNTDRIVVNDVAKHSVNGFITLSGGRFQPGFTNERGSSDEIEFVFNLGEGPTQNFDTHGTDDADFFRLGLGRGGTQRRLNLNSNEKTGVDHDVVVNGEIATFLLEGFDGNDVLRATGRAGTGRVYKDKLWLSGYEGRDRLRAGEGDDVLDGDIGRDVLVAGPGADALEGKPGKDSLKAGRGPDTLRGGLGDDDHTGGPGNDECDDTDGSNSFVGCETVIEN